MGGRIVFKAVQRGELIVEARRISDERVLDAIRGNLLFSQRITVITPNKIQVSLTSLKEAGLDDRMSVARGFIATHYALYNP